MKIGDIVHCVDDSCRGYIPFIQELKISNVIGDVLEVKDLAGKKYLENRKSFRKGKLKLNSKPRVFSQVIFDSEDKGFLKPESFLSSEEIYDSFTRMFPELKVRYTRNLSSYKQVFDFNSKFDGNQIWLGAQSTINNHLYFLHEISHFLEASLSPNRIVDGQKISDAETLNWGLDPTSSNFEREVNAGYLQNQIEKVVKFQTVWFESTRHHKPLGLCLLEKYRKFWPHLLDRPIFTRLLQGTVLSI